VRVSCMSPPPACTRLPAPAGSLRGPASRQLAKLKLVSVKLPLCRNASCKICLRRIWRDRSHAICVFRDDDDDFVIPLTPEVTSALLDTLQQPPPSCVALMFHSPATKLSCVICFCCVAGLTELS
jgi:hypothetical protein